MSVILKCLDFFNLALLQIASRAQPEVQEQRELPENHQNIAKKSPKELSTTALKEALQGAHEHYSELSSEWFDRQSGQTLESYFQGRNSFVISIKKR